MKLSVCMSIKKSVLCIFHMSQKTIKVFCEQNRDLHLDENPTNFCEKFYDFSRRKTIEENDICNRKQDGHGTSLVQPVDFRI